MNKMIALYVMAVLVISTDIAAGQSCSYRLTPDSNIIGGVLAPATGLDACKAYCTSSAACKSFDFDPSSDQCWWLPTQSGLQSNPAIQHYDKICQAFRDVVSNPGNPQCFTTNYQGPVSDLWLSPNGVTWYFQIAHFGFNWPQSGIAFLSLSSLVYINSITFKSSDNLDYFRVVITKNNGKAITTQAIGPNDHSTTVSGANDVKRVDFYLAPVDFKRNVSLNDICIKACTGTGTFRICTIVNLVKDLIEAVSLGIIRLGGTSGTFSASVAPEYPFVDLDLNCAGVGTVSFTSVGFGSTSNISYVVIGVRDGETTVPIVNNNGVAGDTFSDPQNIKFASSVRGNEIRSTIIPSRLPDQGISGTFGFQKYSVLAPAN